MINNSCCGWGYSYWNCNWHGGAVVYRNNVYYGNAAWHGGFYGSTATAYGPYGAARVGTAYNPNTGTYARGGAVATPYGTTRAGQAYNPNTGAYAATHQTSNAYGNYGSSVVSKNGNTAYTQHQTTANGTVASGTNFGRWQRRCRPGQVRQYRRRRPGRKRQQICRGKRQRLQKHRQRLESDTGHATQHKLLRRQLRCRSRLWRSGADKQRFGLWRRRKRLAIQAGKCSWRGQSWWRLSKKIGQQRKLRSVSISKFFCSNFKILRNGARKQL